MSANCMAMPLFARSGHLPALTPARRPLGVLGLMLCIYVALLPAQIEIAVDFRLAPSDFFLFLALILGGAGWRYIAPAWSWWQLCLPVLLSASALVAGAERGELSRYVVVNKGVGLLVLLLFYALVTTATTSWLDLRRLLRVLVVSVTVQNIASLAAFLIGRTYGFYIPWLNGDRYRLCGMLVDANGYGGLLVLALAINEIAGSGEAPLLRPLFKNFASLTLLLGIACTFSRSAWIALSTTLVATWIFRRSVAIRITAVGVLAALSMPLLGHAVLVYGRDMASRPGQIAQRFSIIASAAEYVQEHPFFGAGLGSFVEREGVVVHNTSLWFLAEFGMVGFFVLAGFLAWFFLKGVETYRRAPSAEKPVVLSLVIAHVSMFALSMGIEAFYTRPWWLVMALIGSSYSIALQPDTTGRGGSSVVNTGMLAPRKED